jgi:hypothetical protein
MKGQTEVIFGEMPCSLGCFDNASGRNRLAIISRAATVKLSTRLRAQINVSHSGWTSYLPDRHHPASGRCDCPLRLGKGVFDPCGRQTPCEGKNGRLTANQLPRQGSMCRGRQLTFHTMSILSKFP